MLTLATVLGALPTLMQFVGQGKGMSSLVGEIVGGFKDRPEDQARLRAEIERLANENDEGHSRLQRKLADAARR